MTDVDHKLLWAMSYLIMAHNLYLGHYQAELDRFTDPFSVNPVIFPEYRYYCVGVYELYLDNSSNQHN